MHHYCLCIHPLRYTISFSSLIIIKFRRSKIKNETFTQIHSFFSVVVRVSLSPHEIPHSHIILYVCIIHSCICTFPTHIFFRVIFVLPLCHFLHIHNFLMITLQLNLVNLEFFFFFVRIANCVLLSFYQYLLTCALSSSIFRFKVPFI